MDTTSPVFFLEVITFKVSSLGNFQTHNMILLIIVIMFYIISGLNYLITGSLYLWPPSPISPMHQPMASGNHLSLLFP